MTDKEKAMKLFDEFEIAYKLTDYNSIKIKEGANDKVIGYSWFYTELRFDEDDKFINIGAWE